MTWLISKIVGNPVVLIVLLVGAFAVGVTSGGSAAWWIQGLRVTAAQQETKKVRQDFTKLQQETKEEGLKAKARELAKETEHQANLEKVRNDHERNIQAVRDSAVAKYLASRRVRNHAAGSGGGPVRADGQGLRVDDGTQPQCVPDKELIENAAEDAEKLSAWQDWCHLNNCPVQP